MERTDQDVINKWLPMLKAAQKNLQEVVNEVAKMTNVNEYQIGFVKYTRARENLLDLIHDLRKFEGIKYIVPLGNTIVKSYFGEDLYIYRVKGIKVVRIYNKRLDKAKN